MADRSEQSAISSDNDWRTLELALGAAPSRFALTALEAGRRRAVLVRDGQAHSVRRA
jgi:hypothetical protein